MSSMATACTLLRRLQQIERRTMIFAQKRPFSKG